MCCKEINNKALRISVIMTRQQERRLESLAHHNLVESERGELNGR